MVTLFYLHCLLLSLLLFFCVFFSHEVYDEVIFLCNDETVVARRPFILGSSLPSKTDVADVTDVALYKMSINQKTVVGESLEILPSHCKMKRSVA